MQNQTPPIDTTTHKQANQTIQKQNNTTSTSQQQTNSSTNPKTNSDKQENPKQNTMNMEKKPNENKTRNNQPTTKRTAPSLSSVDSLESLQDETITDKNINNTTNKVRRHSKSRRTRSSSPCTPTEEWLRPAEKLFDPFIL